MAKRFKPKYRYQLYSTGESSSKYGNCEVCGKYASEVWYQSEERTYEPLPGEKGPFWTWEGCRSWFWHKKCLVSKQRRQKRKQTG